MRSRIFTAFIALVFVTAVHAGIHELDGGVLIAHYCEPLYYTSNPPALGWCGEYLHNYAITSHTEQINRIDIQTYMPASWFVIAAWDEEKTWSQVDFGLGDFDSRIFGFLEWDPCYPSYGVEIPTHHWPGPNGGISLLPDEPWEGNYVPVMWFGGYAYGYYGAGTIPIRENPATGSAGFTNTLDPPVTWETVCTGALGIDTDGEACVPIPLGLHPCCIEQVCLMTTVWECTTSGGVFHSEWDTCEPNPCVPTEAACCDLEECTIISAEACQLAGGLWLPGVLTCDPNPCLPGTYILRPDGSGDFPNIQSAISGVGPGSTIWLEDGTYLGTGNHDIDFQGKAITLASLSDDPEACTIFCWTYIPGSHRALNFVSGEDSTSVVRGLKLEGGEVADGGGAVLCSAGSSPTFENCIFADNFSSGHGGALYCADAFSQPLLRDCAFRDNQSLANGGAVYSLGATLAMTNCTFGFNQASDGGAVAIMYSDLESRGCAFLGNQAGNGGAIHLNDCVAIFTACTFERNRSNGSGGAIAAHGTWLAITACTFVDQVTQGNGTISTSAGETAIVASTFYGNRGVPCGGIANSGTGSTIGNTLIAFNEAGSAIDDPSPTLICCDIFGNAGGDWTANIAAQLGVNGNICANPWFCNPDSADLHLQEHSACAPFSPPNEECDLIGAWPVGCEDILHACCVEHSCQMLVFEDCDAIGGDWFEWANTCDPNPCPPYLVLPDGSGAYATIQAAINWARPGETILLADGTFSGVGNRNLGYLGKPICIRSQSGVPETCIIDCSGNPPGEHRGVRFLSNDGGGAVLEDITIINAAAGLGGAIECCEGSGPTLRNLRLIDNQANWFGGGMALCGASPTISGVTFINNSAGDEGGGLWSSGGNPVLSDLEFRENHANLGGGAFLKYLTIPLERCDFRFNTATTGAGLYCYSSSPMIEETTFAGNIASHSGGGLACYQATPSLTQVTFSGNAASHGGGICCIADAAVYLENSIIAFSTQGKAIDVGNPGYIPQLTCCDLYGNAGGDWTSTFASQYGHHGNICRNPLFCDPEGGDLRIHAHSPCSPHAPASSICGLLGAWPATCTNVRIQAQLELPTALDLRPGMPDPFSDTIRFHVHVPETESHSPLRLEIFDATGRKVKTLADDFYAPGILEVTWDGRAAGGHRVARGVYFCRLELGDRTLARRIVFTK